GGAECQPGRKPAPAGSSASGGHQSSCPGYPPANQQSTPRAGTGSTRRGPRKNRTPGRSRSPPPRSGPQPCRPTRPQHRRRPPGPRSRALQAPDQPQRQSAASTFLPLSSRQPSPAGKFSSQKSTPPLPYAGGGVSQHRLYVAGIVHANHFLTRLG